MFSKKIEIYMDTIVHSWVQLGTFLIATFVFMWYMRKDSKEDYIRLDTKLEEWREETNCILTAIQQEIKDFHGRLCALEEKNKGK